MVEVEAAIKRIEDELCPWGSIDMRLSSEALADIRAIIEFAREHLPPPPVEKLE